MTCSAYPIEPDGVAISIGIGRHEGAKKRANVPNPYLPQHTTSHPQPSFKFLRANNRFPLSLSCLITAASLSSIAKGLPQSGKDHCLVWRGEDLWRQEGTSDLSCTTYPNISIQISTPRLLPLTSHTHQQERSTPAKTRIYCASTVRRKSCSCAFIDVARFSARAS
jgi:hypothetical protein